MTEFIYLPLGEADQAKGIVVVIDVLRAFTTAAYAFSKGAVKIYPVQSAEDALRLNTSLPGSITMGEVDGFQPEVFDLGNSPVEIMQSNLDGKILIQRTSAGTQGIINCVNADQILAGSFVVAKSTAAYLQTDDHDAITFLITGASQGRDGDEDLACGEYIEALIKGDHIEPDPYIKRVWDSSVGRSFLNGENRYLRQEDIKMSIKADLFEFYLSVELETSFLVMKPGQI